jgi:uncharacterized membrane protein YczE
MDPEEPYTEESASESLARSRLGRKPQVGGGLAVFIGILLLVFVPAAQPGMPDIHRMAIIFIVIGTFLIAVGTFARWYFLK